MAYSIIPTPNFQREFKKLYKKFPSIKNDLMLLADSLLDEPLQGSEIFKNCYKIRLAIKSKGKGKSGGARVITFVQIVDEKIYFLSVYDKGEIETVTDAFLRQLLKDL
jgi:mRNA-degrading endonuclease RelE of RelBE toxin-antitoxin system